jgi:hypothetical protein
MAEVVATSSKKRKHNGSDSERKVGSDKPRVEVDADLVPLSDEKNLNAMVKIVRQLVVPNAHWVLYACGTLVTFTTPPSDFRPDSDLYLRSAALKILGRTPDDWWNDRVNLIDYLDFPADQKVYVYVYEVGQYSLGIKRPTHYTHEYGFAQIQVICVNPKSSDPSMDPIDVALEYGRVSRIYDRDGLRVVASCGDDCGRTDEHILIEHVPKALPPRTEVKEKSERKTRSSKSQGKSKPKAKAKSSKGKKKAAAKEETKEPDLSKPILPSRPLSEIRKFVLALIRREMALSNISHLKDLDVKVMTTIGKVDKEGEKVGLDSEGDLIKFVHVKLYSNTIFVGPDPNYKRTMDRLAEVLSDVKLGTGGMFKLGEHDDPCWSFSFPDRGVRFHCQGFNWIDWSE